MLKRNKTRITHHGQFVCLPVFIKRDKVSYELKCWSRFFNAICSLGVSYLGVILCVLRYSSAGVQPIKLKTSQNK